MTIADMLKAHLGGDPEIAAAVLTKVPNGPGVLRIYPLRLPQKPIMPSIVFHRISSVRAAHLRGQGSLARPRFQIDCWDSTYVAATTLGALVRKRLEGYKGVWSDMGHPSVTANVTALFVTETDLFEAEILGGIARHSADYFIFHSTAGGAL